MKHEVRMAVNKLQDQTEEVLDRIEDEMQAVWDDTRRRMEEMPERVLVKIGKGLNEREQEMDGEVIEEMDMDDEMNGDMEIYNAAVFD
jgi:hypothetical protein